ncbi:MAG: hypothetical protein FWE37_01340 [Spirochaetaceae bacterium]|jgi:hypothetical protein|nr:hypothetical protein [Spirochaetaceae bacterium]
MKNKNTADYVLLWLYVVCLVLTIIFSVSNLVYVGSEAAPLLLTSLVLIGLYRSNLWLPKWYYNVGLVIAAAVAIIWMWVISPNNGYYWLPFALTALFVPLKLSVPAFFLLIFAFFTRNLMLRVDIGIMFNTATTYTGGFIGVLMAKRQIELVKEEATAARNQVTGLKTELAAERAEKERLTAQLAAREALNGRTPKMPVVFIKEKDKSGLTQHLVEGKKQNNCLKENPKASESPYYSSGHISRILKEALEYNNLTKNDKQLLADCLKYDMYEIIEDYNEKPLI